MYKLSLIKTINGDWTFVGSVPFDLGFVHKDGRIVSKAEASFIEGQMRLPAKYRTVKNRVFKSYVAATEEVIKLGYKELL